MAFGLQNAAYLQQMLNVCEASHTETTTAFTTQRSTRPGPKTTPNPPTPPRPPKSTPIDPVKASGFDENYTVSHTHARGRELKVRLV